MGACGLAALVVLLLASALLPSAASSRVLEGKSNSGKDATPPTVAVGGSRNSDAPKESGQSSASKQQAERSGTATKDSKLPSTGEVEKKGQDAGEARTSATSPPPPPPQAQTSATSPPPPPPSAQTTVPKASPPPGGPGPNVGDETKGGTNHEDKGSHGKEDATDKLKEEAMEKCDDKCSFGKEFSACLYNNASIGPVVIVRNDGQNVITVNVKSNIDIDKKPLQLAKGSFGQMVIRNSNPDGGEITLNDGNGDCVLHIRQSVSDWQQQFQQFAAYATRLNPIYGAYLFGFTVVLVGVVCVCCKFARRRSNGGVPYQQLEMSAPAPNSSGADNTTSTADGWEDGWDDDWDDEEAPARPSDKKPVSSVSGNGLSLRSRTDSKDGWDVDWDD